MKKVLLFTTACICSSILSAQYIYKIKADSVLITNDSCTAELIIENKTKDTIGFLFNKGKGRTEFRRMVTKIDSVTYIIGGLDTIRVGGSATGDYILNQNASDQSASFRISGSGLLKGGLSSQTSLGANNQQLGDGALASVSSSSHGHTAIGNNALNAITGSTFGNTAVGYGAIALNTSGSELTAIGTGSLSNFTSGNGNTAVGYHAMHGGSAASGYGNLAFGRSSLFNITSGYQNIAIGDGASQSITTGYLNVNVGGGALSTSATYNVGMGHGALGSASGSFNIALGTQSLENLTTGSSNIGIGYYANGSITTGNYNVSIGGQAGISNNGSNNIFIGYLAGYNATGSSNIFLGNNAGFYETGSNKLYIDNSTTSTPLLYGDFSNDTVRVNGKFHANGPVKIDLGSDATGDIYYRNSSGQFTNLGIGSTGQVLTVNGSSLPVWQTPGGGGISDPGGNGILARTALNTTTARTITGTSNKIAITNGDGVSGNPTINVGSDIVQVNQSNTYTAGNKQIFSADGTNADIKLTGNSSDPSSLSAGDIWYNSTSHVFKGRFNSTTRQLATLDGTETLTNKSIDASQLTGSVAVARLTNIKQVKGITLVSPTSSENATIFYTTQAITIEEVRGVLLGSSQSVTLVLNYGSSRATADGTIVASNTFDSGDSGYQTTGFTFTLNTTSIPANSYIWLTTSAASGTINDFNLTITYKQ